MAEESKDMLFESGAEGSDSVEEEHSPERMKIKPTLTIIIPEGFEVKKDDFQKSLKDVLDDAQISIDELRKRGYEYTDKRVYPVPIEIRMKEIKGTEHSTGWNGIIEGIGQIAPDRRTPYTLEQTLDYAKRLVELTKDKSNQERLDSEISGINLACVRRYLQTRAFMVDADGRARTMVLKALEKAGCSVSISGIKVSTLE